MMEAALPLAGRIDWLAFREELTLLGVLGLSLIATLFKPRAGGRLSGWLLLAGGLFGLGRLLLDPVADRALWDGFYVVDPMARFFKALFLLGLVLAVLASLRYLAGKEHKGEYYLCLGSSALGMMLLASAAELIILFVALELTSISLYLLASLLREEEQSREAGLKYLLIGAFSSGLFLYGASLIYAACGSTSLGDIAQLLPGRILEPLILIGMIFIIAAVGFKIAAAPFHMWAPDVYQGAPTPVVAFASTASKAAGFAILIRLMMGAFDGMQGDWMMLLALVAALTMVVGSFLAIPQSNIKRLLAYSSIAQAGYLLVGFVAGSEKGLSSVMFYLLVYMFTNVGAFLVVILMARHAGGDDLKGYDGLAQRSPLLALAMMFSLLSLAGIPPLGGFVGKLYLFAAAMEQQSRLLWLVVLAVTLSIISLYYYLLVLRRIYIEAPKEPGRIPVDPAAAVALLVCMAGVVVTGLLPRLFLSKTIEIARKFLST